MTGACHHLRPAAVFYDDRPEAQKAVLSIAGAKIRRFLVSDKFRHVIRSDFQQNTYDLKLRKKTDSISYGAHLYILAVSKTIFCDINQHITK